MSEKLARTWAGESVPAPGAGPATLASTTPVGDHPCPFCVRIKGGDFESFTDDPDVVWFEPLNPVTPGHMLFVPVEHVTDALADPYTTGLVAEVASRWWSRKWGIRAGQRDCNLITSVGANATQTVRHLHWHLVPRDEGDGLALPWTDQREPQERPIVGGGHGVRLVDDVRSQGGSDGDSSAGPVSPDTGKAQGHSGDSGDAHEALAAALPDEWVRAAEGWYSMHGSGLVRNLLAGAVPLIQAAERERVADRQQVIDEVKAELDDAFQFTDRDGSRHGYVTRAWVESLLAHHAASAAAAERERVARLAEEHGATYSDCPCDPARGIGDPSHGPVPFADLIREGKL